MQAPMYGFTLHLRAAAMAAALIFFTFPGGAAAQTAAKPGKPAPPSANKTSGTPSAAAWRIGPLPDWVVAPPHANEIEEATLAPHTTQLARPADTSSAQARRELLLDYQQLAGVAKPQLFVRVRQVATDASTVGFVSQPQIEYNPAFHRVVIHNAYVWRGGKRLDRLNDARIEVMRREKQLEQQMITGTETLLVVLNDIRVGEPVELAYTVEGENPIFEGRISAWMQLASNVPVNVLHNRIVAPAGKQLQIKQVGIELPIERSTQSGRQVLSVVRRNVAPVTVEQNTPAWHRSYPWIHTTDYAGWQEVDEWARRLFARPNAPNAGLAEPVAQLRAKNLKDEALVAEILRFVQDEVRYFSVSLGQSSHKPKPPERTLADRLGDCKDKTLLLNALLEEFGFKAQPALVSLRMNRGISQYLPAHDLFDHVVSRVEVNGRTYFLDSTAQGQGLSLETRGHFDFGQALIVGAGADVQAAAEPDYALNQIEFEQVWDYSAPGKPVKLTATLRAKGVEAERWRAGLAMVGEERLIEGLSGAHLRIVPGLQKSGPIAVTDDRASNQFSIGQGFTHPQLGKYSMGTLEVDYSAVELLDAMIGPQEPTRRTPFALPQPKYVDSRVVFIAPRAWNIKSPPAPIDINDKHLRLTVRIEIAGEKLIIKRRVERKADHVQPADLQVYRESIIRMRQAIGGQLRIGLMDATLSETEITALEQRVQKDARWKKDSLGSILLGNEFTRHVDGRVLSTVDAKSPLAARIYISRSNANSLLGDYAAALQDADAALAVQPALDEALEARGLALAGQGRIEDALRAFQQIGDWPRRTFAQHWIGSLQLYLGQPAKAETALRFVIENGRSEERDFALLWLYIAAEQQGPGRGKTAIAPHLQSTDDKRLPGAILRFLDGSLDREALIKQAREKPEMERLNLAEAYFFIGQKAALSGQSDDAARWFTRTLETGATPYREVTFARYELQRKRK